MLKQKYRLGLQRPPNYSPATRGRPRQMNVRRHLANQSSPTSTSQSNSPQVPHQFVRKSAHEDTSTSGDGSLEAVDESTTRWP